MINFTLPEPQVDKFGNNRNIVIPLPIEENTNQYFRFSFELFSREHSLFNLGGKEKYPEAISGEWFIALFDCLKEVSNTKIFDLRTDVHDLHPVDWESNNINTGKPEGHEQLDYWQFRLNKSDGRVIGVKIDNTFYIVWLDPYHNLTNSEGYGKARYYYRPLTQYEKIVKINKELQERVNILEEENQIYEDLLNNYQ